MFKPISGLTTALGDRPARAGRRSPRNAGRSRAPVTPGPRCSARFRGSRAPPRRQGARLLRHEGHCREQNQRRAAADHHGASHAEPDGHSHGSRRQAAEPAVSARKPSRPRTKKRTGTALSGRCLNASGSTVRPPWTQARGPARGSRPAPRSRRASIPRPGAATGGSLPPLPPPAPGPTSPPPPAGRRTSREGAAPARGPRGA